MTVSVNRTILLLDIERFSDRDDVEQRYLRRRLYDVTDRALESAGIDQTQRLRADRGDGLIELIDAAPVPVLLRTLLTEVPAGLREWNRMASSSAQLRLRVVVADGYVAVHTGDDYPEGWVGTQLNDACRLLDAEVLRSALRERTEDMVLGVSSGIYTGVVRHQHRGVPADEFHRVTAHGKNGPMEVWVHGAVPHPVDGTDGHVPRSSPGEVDLAQDTAPYPAPEAARNVHQLFQPNGGCFSFGGSQVLGDQHGVSGGNVTGNVHLGSHAEVHHHGTTEPRTERGDERA